jgi:putative pyruvate formate lyase activating enzyme
MGHGKQVSVERLGEMMLELQDKGAHNINFVTPTHFVPQILQAVAFAAGQGLSLPLVYNTSGYEQVATLELLDGVIDIWLPDAKYADSAAARRLSGFKDYVRINRLALREMYRQVGDELCLGEDGIATRGMIIRHLVLPNQLAGTAQVLQWIAKDLSHKVHVSLMDQYFPAHRVHGDAELGRRISQDEYEHALLALESAGLENGWYQSTARETNEGVEC